MARQKQHAVGENTESQVMVGASVDVSEASEQQKRMYLTMAEMVESNYKVFVNKNLDYSSSFLVGGQKDALHDGGPFDTPREANLYQTYTRIQDKDNRFYNLVFNDHDRQVNDEDVIDVCLDAANYYLMLALILKDGWKGANDDE